MKAEIISTVDVSNVALRVIEYAGQNWLMSHDIAAALGYKGESGIRQHYSRNRHREQLAGHSVKVEVSGFVGSEHRLFDEVAIRHLCEKSHRPGAFKLLAWLHAGGLSQHKHGSSIAAPFQTGERLNTLDQRATDLHATTSATEPAATAEPASTPPASQAERHKSYGLELLAVVMQHASEEEAKRLARLIESEAYNLVRRSHRPALNSARYEVYSRYWLQGGEA